MKHLLLTAVVLASASAQTLTITGPTVVKPGSVVTGTITLSGTTEAAGLQWTLIKPANVFVSGTVESAAAAAASKKLYTNKNNGVSVLVGTGTQRFAAGDVATFTFMAPQTGSVKFDLAGSLVYGSTALGATVPLTAGPSWTVAVLDPSFDLNRDSKVDGLDLMSSVMQILGLSPCTTADLNKDDKCTIEDHRLLLAAPGASFPTAPPVITEAQ